MYLNKLKNYGGELLFECNCTKYEINNMFKNDTFLCDILNSWFTIKTTGVDISAINFKTEIVWNNCFFKIANKTFFFKTWFEHGIKYVHDILNPQTRQRYNFIDLINIYNLPPSDFLNFMSLISCLRTTCKQNMETQFNIANNNNKTVFSKIMKTKQANKVLYSHQLNKDKPDTIVSQEKWSATFENLKWDIIYSNTFISSIDVKLRNFQYKYIFRIIPTNKRLFIQNIVNSNLCDFCSMHIETIQHLFWECNYVQTFWNKLHRFLQNTNIGIEMNYKVISFGICNKDENDDIKNFVIFYAKYFIFLNKCGKTIPRWEFFKTYISKRIQMEQEIALMNDKLPKFETKWRLFSSYLT